jgi:Xaa-Pro aminopeptidase
MTTALAGSAGFAPSVHRERLANTTHAAAERGIDAVLITPSSDYGYLLGYRAPVLERLTCLVLRTGAAPTLVVPRLEEPLARHELGELVDEIEVIAWDETEDPFRVVQRLLGGTRRVAVQDQMWARFVLRLAAVLDPAELVPAGPTVSALRRVKSAAEIDRLRRAAAADDAAMRAIVRERLSGRTEAEVSGRIRELLVEHGLDTADFAIVASGPNSASPHHDAGDRVIEPGDAIVLDIGGTLDGYWADTTRTAFVGEPPADFAALYAVLQEAQRAACDAVKPGITCAELDAVARDIIADAGYGAAFIHRTGHGIGVELHEEPYVVASNDEPLEVGHAFSVEPGIYLSGQWGARIEDIVICTPNGGERLNTTPTELYVVD